MTLIAEGVLEYATAVWWAGFLGVGAGVSLLSFRRWNDVRDGGALQ
jgi:hypothetical protein